MSKRVYLLCLLFFAGTWVAHSQDMLLTADGDSIPGKLIKVENGIVHFLHKNAEGEDERLEVSTKEATYMRDFYGSTSPTSVVPNAYARYPHRAQETYSLEAKAYPAFRIGVLGGYSYSLFTDYPYPDNSGMAEHSSSMRSGFHLTADASFFVWKRTALGLRYMYFDNSASGTFASFDPQFTRSNQGTATMTAEHTSLHYVAGKLLFRYPMAERWMFYYGFDMGPVFYRNTIDFFYNQDNNVQWKRFVSGTTVGINLNAAFDYALTDRFSLSLSVSWWYAYLTTRSYQDALVQNAGATLISNNVTAWLSEAIYLDKLNLSLGGYVRF